MSGYTTGPQGPERPVLRVGTRGSVLATTQAGHVRDALVAAGYPAELVIVRTRGDVVMAPVERIGVGVFTQELRDALDRGDCDVAVHSYKDLPTAPDERFAPIVVPPRADPSDVLVTGGGGFAELRRGARVGTSAPRRRAQLAALRPDLDLRPVRGNIDTRMGFVTSGELDAVVLAAAGLDRVGRGEVADHRFVPAEMLPAPAQGALAVECRAGDDRARAAIAQLDHASSRFEVAAERRVLAVLEAGCTAPVGALARIDGDTLRVEAVAAAPDGSAVLRSAREVTLPAAGGGAGGDAREAAARSAGDQVARELLDRGAAELMTRADATALDAPLVPPESTTAPPTVHPGAGPGDTAHSTPDAPASPEATDRSQRPGPNDGSDLR